MTYTIMVRLECIEEGCSYITQDLPFDQAERILDMHLNRKHPVNNVSMAPSLPNLRMPPVSVPKLNRRSRSFPPITEDQGISLSSDAAKAEWVTEFSEHFGTERLTKNNCLTNQVTFSYK